LSGLWHIGASPISKHNLLQLLRTVYNHSIEVSEDPGLVIDRTLDSSRFSRQTGYAAPDWPVMVTHMYQRRG
jgi:dTDP-4-dehydrorhamnose reductase